MKKKALLLPLIGSALLISFLNAGCQKEYDNPIGILNTEPEPAYTDPAPSEDDTMYLYEHVAFIDARIRSINSSEYVREIVTKDFNETSEFNQGYMVFHEEEFNDLGEGYDETGGDGIFTSANVYEHDDERAYNPSELITSISQTAVVDEKFEHDDDLMAYLASYPYHDTTPSSIIEITCKIRTYYCPPWSINLGVWCIEIYACTDITFGW